MNYIINSQLLLNFDAISEWKKKIFQAIVSSGASLGVFCLFVFFTLIRK